ncbi:MAG TPA: M1 family metallopeptidase [Longimicrobiales bacterium]|nr:M1 family metallopeptidase [Longimicrobiales bacterium]
MPRRPACTILLALTAACTAAPPPTTPAPPPASAATEPPPIEAGRKPAPGDYAGHFDALHYTVELDLREATATPPRIQGTTQIDVARTGSTGDTLVLDFTGLRVLGIRAGAAIRMGGTQEDRARSTLQDVAFRYDAGRLHIPLGGITADTLRVEIRYDGTPDDALIIRDNVHGTRTAFADNWPNRARFWIPSIDHPSDKAGVSFAVRAPEGWTVIANGPRSDGRAPTQPPTDGVWRFAATEPIPTYTMVIGAGPLTETVIDECAEGGTGTCVPTRLYTFAPDSAKAWPSFRRAGTMLEYYSRLIAPYPYAKLDHAQSATAFGGMENVGAIFYSEQAIAQGQDIEVTVAHEIVHQWFGDGVTERNWQHLWLSEGFATYFASLFFEDADGADAFRAQVEQARAAYLQSGDARFPLVDTTATLMPDLFALLNTNSYQKGALVLHMLRGMLGDDAFLDGIRRYYNAHRYGTALSEDLRRSLEQSSGRELGAFFQQWVYSPGHPVLRHTHTYDDAADEIVVTIEQVQPEEWPVFHFDTELVVVGGGESTRVPVRVRERMTTVRVPAASAPDRMVLDPDGWLLYQPADAGGAGGTR